MYAYKYTFIYTHIFIRIYLYVQENPFLSGFESPTGRPVNGSHGPTGQTVNGPLNLSSIYTVSGAGKLNAKNRNFNKNHNSVTYAVRTSISGTAPLYTTPEDNPSWNKIKVL
jgi:hypothetical protein